MTVCPGTLCVTLCVTVCSTPTLLNGTVCEIATVVCMSPHKVYVFKNIVAWASAVAQWIKVLATKPEALSFAWNPHGEQETRVLQLVL